MKNKILFSVVLFCACMFAMQANAQLEVHNSGDVKVSKNLDVADTLTVGEYFRATNNLVLGKNIRTTNNATIGKNLLVSQNVAIGGKYR